MITIISSIYVFLLGLVIGSFLNVCIYRIPRGESIVIEPSHCTGCGVRLRARNLIPVASYVLQGGKCYSCNEKISPRYILIEMLTGVLFTCLFYKYNFSFQLLETVFLSSILIVPLAHLFQ